MMSFRNGLFLLGFLCCGWPMVILAIIKYGPRIWAWIETRIPNNDND